MIMTLSLPLRWVILWIWYCLRSALSTLSDNKVTAIYVSYEFEFYFDWALKELFWCNLRRARGFILDFITRKQFANFFYSWTAKRSLTVLLTVVSPDITFPKEWDTHTKKEHKFYFGWPPFVICMWEIFLEGRFLFSCSVLQAVHS